ncbi:MAG: hypothetical protein KUL88_21635 [Rhizobium sp.]|nr:hypothetical protein [Rhizobium sp.]
MNAIVIVLKLLIGGTSIGQGPRFKFYGEIAPAFQAESSRAGPIAKVFIFKPFLIGG